MDISLQIMILLALIAANGVFALAEIAVVSARKTRLEAAAEGGDRGAERVLALKAAPDNFLSTVQVGITLIGVLAGAFGGASLGTELAARLGRVPVLAPYAPELAFTSVVAAITFLSVVLGELVPKQIALLNPERAAKLLAPTMRALAWGAAPVIWLLSKSTQVVLALLRVKADKEAAVTEDEIRVILEQGAVAGVLERAEHSLFERVMEFADRRAESMMTPRTQVVWVDVNAPIGDNIRAMSDAVHSYFPVCDGQIDKALGIVSVKELWRRLVRDKQVPDLRDCLMTVPHVPESITALRLLETLKQSGRHIALVFDEYGGISGLVSLHDLMEALVGDLPQEEDQEEQWAVQRPDGSWLLDGMLAVSDMADAMKLRRLPDDADEYNTVAGLILAKLGRLPKVGETIEWAGVRFEVMDLDGLRIDRVLATPLPQETDGTETPREPAEDAGSA